MSTTEAAIGVGLPASGTWNVDPVHSSVSFVARHLVVTKVRGRFASFSAAIDVDAIPERSSVHVTIDAASIETGEPKRDGHLRSPDFLDVERFPALTFRSTRLEQTGPERFNLHGDLTIRDTTRPVTLDVEFLGLAQDPWGGSRASFSATTEIDREDFGMTWNQALEAGGVLVGKKVKIELDIQAVRAA